jgi:tetratricopeptide (TPR) repeat protein
MNFILVLIQHIRYRIFAEQIDIATRYGFKPPVPHPSQTHSGSPPLNSSPFLGSGGHSNQLDGGINPGELLQHAGFYYHLAAMCSAERRRRYIEVEKMKNSETKIDDPTYFIAMKTLEEEEKIDHSALTIELLTKGYEQFKKHRNSRMTLYLAAEIAGTYYEAGKFDMALKFFERIGKTYRKEHWHTVLTSILRWSLRCAKELNMTASAIGYLIELLCDDLPMSEEKRIELQNDLRATLMEETAGEHGNSEEPLIISMDDINSFLKCNVQFEKRSSYINEPIKFQVVITSNKHSPPEAIDFQSLRVIFNNDKWNQMYLHDKDSTEKDEDYQYHDCSDSKCNQETNVWEANTNLLFRNGQTKIFEGMINANHTENLKVICCLCYCYYNI